MPTAVAPCRSPESTRVPTPPADDDVAVSVVIPVYNEQGCLPELHRRLTTVMQSTGRTYELVMVDDGSTDASLEIMRRLSRQDSRTRYVSFARNFGQAAAITAGQMAARGSAVVTIDADLQNPPEEIPKLLARFEEGFDVVYGVRKNRQDPWLRRLCSGLVTRMLQSAMHISVQPNVTAFMIAHRRVIDELNRCPERTRFHPALCAWLGARTADVEVQHGERFTGKSKYSYWKLVVRSLDLLTGFTHVPLRLAGWIGMSFAVFGFGLAAWAVLRKLLFGGTLLGWPSIMAAIGLLGGVQLLTIGVLGEYVGRSYSQLLNRPLYVIRETTPAGLDGPGLRFPPSATPHPQTRDDAQAPRS